MPTDLVREPVEEGLVDVQDYSRRLVNRLADAYQFVKMYNDRQKQERESRLNEDWQPHEFKEGDLVWLYAYARKEGYSNKFKLPWQGPFHIHTLVSPVTAKLYKMNGRLLKALVNVGRLKKFYEPRAPDYHIDLDAIEGDDIQEGDLEEEHQPGDWEPSRDDPCRPETKETEQGQEER
jgi:hypothetical protein